MNAKLEFMAFKFFSIDMDIWIECFVENMLYDGLRICINIFTIRYLNHPVDNSKKYWGVFLRISNILVVVGMPKL